MADRTPWHGQIEVAALAVCLCRVQDAGGNRKFECELGRPPDEQLEPGSEDECQRTFVHLRGRHAARQRAPCEVCERSSGPPRDTPEQSAEYVLAGLERLGFLEAAREEAVA